MDDITSVRKIFVMGGPIMKGTSVIMGTRYAWNIDNKGVHICLEHKLHWGLNMSGTLFNGD